MRQPHAGQPRRRPRILIVCEGRRTEPTYFQGLAARQDIRRTLDFMIKVAGGGDARQVVNHALELLRQERERGLGAEQVWCILDAEGQNSLPILREALATAHKAGINVILSNPCFEVWLIAHCERTNRPFHSAMDAKSYFSSKHWRKLAGRDYEESEPQIYALLEDKIETAIANAKHVLEVSHDTAKCEQSNSSTEVYRLIQTLLSREN